MTKKRQSVFIPDNKYVLFARSVELSSPLSIDDCCKRLVALNGEKLGNGVKVRAFVRDEGMNDQRFGMRAKGGRSPDAWLAGVLSPRDDGGTQFSGVVGAAPDVIFYLAIPILMVIVLGIYTGSFSSLVVSFPIAIVIYAIFAIVIKTSKDGLEEKLRIVLETE